MKFGEFEFSLRELGGSLGDLGTFLPLAVGYIAVCRVDPAGLLVMMGIVNIVLGLVYRLPMPVEPMKVLAVVAIAQAWTPGMVHASALAMGATWLLLGLTGVIDRIAEATPKEVIRGIQVSLGLLLAKEALNLAGGEWVLFLASLAVIVFLRGSRHAPASVVLVVAGVLMAAVCSDGDILAAPGFRLPEFRLLLPAEAWDSFIRGGLAQIPLTATNAVIATSALISAYWPGRVVTERQLAVNMGVMNLAVGFFGGMPMCHGAGGLAGQYYFGARTGGANIIEGAFEIVLGVFFAASIAAAFAAFPGGILGAMMLAVGMELLKFAGDLPRDRRLAAAFVTVAVSVAFNMAWGFAAGLFMHRFLKSRWAGGGGFDFTGS